MLTCLVGSLVQNVANSGSVPWSRIELAFPTCRDAPPAGREHLPFTGAALRPATRAAAPACWLRRAGGGGDPTRLLCVSCGRAVAARCLSEVKG